MGMSDTINCCTHNVCSVQKWFYPQTSTNISFNTTFNPINGSSIAVQDSHLHVFCHPIKECNSLVTVRLVFMCTNQCIHQSHAGLADRAAPTFRFSKAPQAGASIHLHTCRHARSHTHAAPYLTKSDIFEFYRK